MTTKRHTNKRVSLKKKKFLAYLSPVRNPPGLIVTFVVTNDKTTRTS